MRKRLKKNPGFSLLEVIITVAILTTAIVFIFRIFTAVLSYAKLSQNISLACFLAEDKLWEIQQNWKDGRELLPPSGEELIQGKKFNWNYTTETETIGTTNLAKLKLNLSWQENTRGEQKYSIDTYLMPQ